jgi:tetratricopeptide (TPR) repeat protein
MKLLERGRLEEAEALCMDVLRVRRDFDAIYTLGVIKNRRGHVFEAMRLLVTALQMRPNAPEALSSYGEILNCLNRYPEALASLDRALLYRPDDPFTHYNRGNSLAGLMRFAEALESFDRALAIKVDFAEAFTNRSNALYALGRYQDALASADRALEIKPQHVTALNNRGTALMALHRDAEAIASFDRVVAIKPAHIEALNNRGSVLQRAGRHVEALENYERALGIYPRHVTLLNNRGTALLALNRLEQALASFDHALKIDPNNIDVINNRCSALQLLNRHEEALADYRRILVLAPGFVDAHWNESLARLAIGDLCEGWKKYEWRWLREPLASARRTYRQPLWLGEEHISGRTIFVYAEQGFGDTIQFVRYTKLLLREGAKVILEVQPPLLSLLESIPGITVIAQGETPPAFHCHCPLLSLPLAFNTDINSIPASVPYLLASEKRADKWSALLPDRTRPRIGLVWSGGARKGHANLRAIELKKLHALLEKTDMQFIALQKDLSDSDVEVLSSMPNLTKLQEEFRDFADTAAIVSLLDLVISIDTSVAHLTGALGKPVWIMLPFSADWRWLRHRGDSPWYPSARLFRQRRSDDWDEVVELIRCELATV